MEIHKVEKTNRGLYTVDGSIHPRKDLQLVKGNVIKAPTKTKAQQKQRDIQDKVGKSLNNPEVKDLVGVKTKKETKEILESGRKTRSQTAGTTMTLRDRKTKYSLLYFRSNKIIFYHEYGIILLFIIVQTLL